MVPTLYAFSEENVYKLIKAMKTEDPSAEVYAVFISNYLKYADFIFCANFSIIDRFHCSFRGKVEVLIAL